MPATKMTVDRKVDNVQHQLDIMRRESEAFRAHANKHFEFLSNEVATKDDLYKMEGRLRAEMATKDDLDNLTKVVAKIDDKVKSMDETLAKMGTNLDRVAEKVDILAQGVDGLIKTSKLTP